MTRLYHACQIFSVVGIGSFMLLGLLGAAGGESEDGIPWAAPTVGALALVIVAEVFWRRGERCNGSLAALYRAVAACYAVGAACGAQVPLVAMARLCGFQAPVLVQWLLLLAVPRLLWISGKLAKDLPTLEMRASAVAIWFSLIVLILAMASGPPAAPLAAALICGAVWGLQAAAPVALLVWLPPAQISG